LYYLLKDKINAYNLEIFVLFLESEGEANIKNMIAYFNMIVFISY